MANEFFAAAALLDLSLEARVRQSEVMGWAGVVGPDAARLHENNTIELQLWMGRGSAGGQIDTQINR